MAAELTPHEAEKQLADDYLKGAVLARTVSYKALELALKQIEDGTLRDPAKTAMNAAITSGTLLDKRLILEGRPTQIIHTDPRAEIRAMAREFGITIDSTATDVEAQPALPRTTESPELPLPTERASAKRARTRAKRPVQTAAD